MYMVIKDGKFLRTQYVGHEFFKTKPSLYTKQHALNLAETYGGEIVEVKKND